MKGIYNTQVKEKHIDSYEHVNNAAYLELLEEARWDYFLKKNITPEDVHRLQRGPIILEVHLKFRKELLLNDQICIETLWPKKNDRKVFEIEQTLLKDNKVACHAVFLMGIFDLKARKMVVPSEPWIID